MIERKEKEGKEKSKQTYIHTNIHTFERFSLKTYRNFDKEICPSKRYMNKGIHLYLMSLFRRYIH